jgi:proteasome-associated ATPase
VVITLLEALMQRRENNAQAPELLHQQLAAVMDSGLAVVDKLRHLTMLRAAAPAEEIDRSLLERIGRLDGGLRVAQQKQAEFTELLEKFTAPPFFPAIYQNMVETVNGTSAVVRLGTDLRAVSFGDAVEASDLAPGDEVLLGNERNVIVAIAQSSCFDCGELATFSRFLSGSRCVVKSRDEETVVIATAALRASGVSSGDQVRVDRTFGLAFERVERSRGEEYFLQDTPEESFEHIGGLEREIEQIQRIFTLHCFHTDIVRKYRHKAKRSVLLYGPSGTGKTMLARATANWLARMSKHGRSRFMNVKPGALHSMWYSQTEANYREVFRVAKEAAAQDPEVFTVIFFDEVDSIGSMRGESVHRIDDRVLNSFMAELSGLEDRGNVVVVAATNRARHSLGARRSAGRSGAEDSAAQSQGRKRDFSAPHARRHTVRLQRRRPGSSTAGHHRLGDLADLRRQRRQRTRPSYLPRRQAARRAVERNDQRGRDCRHRPGSHRARLPPPLRHRAGRSRTE